MTPCTTNPDLWFSEKPDEIKRAKMLCRGCPLLDSCRDTGWTQPHGVYAGLSAAERAAINPDGYMEGVKLGYELSRLLDDRAAGLDAGAWERRVMYPGVCLVASCLEPPEPGGHGWCSPHYRRWRDKGTPIAEAKEPIRECMTKGCKNTVRERKKARKCWACGRAARLESESRAREVMFLVDAGISYQDVAGLTGLTKNTVNGIVQRARRRRAKEEASRQEGRAA